MRAARRKPAGENSKYFATTPAGLRHAALRTKIVVHKDQTVKMRSYWLKITSDGVHLCNIAVKTCFEKSNAYVISTLTVLTVPIAWSITHPSFVNMG